MPGRLTPLRFEITPADHDLRVDAVGAQADAPSREPGRRRSGAPGPGRPRRRSRDGAAGSHPCRRRRLPGRNGWSRRHHVEPAARDGADADLRTLQILQDADRPADLLLQGADRGVDLGVILLVPWLKFSRKVSTPARNRALQHLGRGAGRSDGGDDLGVGGDGAWLARPRTAASSAGSGDQDGADSHSRWSGSVPCDQIAERLEEGVAVVLGPGMSASVEARAAPRASVSGATMAPAASPRCRRCRRCRRRGPRPRDRPQRDRKAKQEFRVAAAAAWPAADGDGRLSTREEDAGAGTGTMGARRSWRCRP